MARLPPLATLTVEDKERRRKARLGREHSESVAEIGAPPLTRAQLAAGTRLRKKYANDLAGFLQNVFPQSTGLKPFGSAQLDSISQVQRVICHGGRVQLLEPRGFGKTSRAVGAALWAVLFGHRRFVFVAGSSADRASEIIDSWRVELRVNDKLLQMFPEICWPIRALEDKHQRCKSQTFRGARTMMTWTSELLALPHVDHVAAGAVLCAKPLGSARGTHFRAESGRVLRPDLVILDDLQRDGDALSPTTVSRILSSIKKSILRLGGRESDLAVLHLATPIAPGDVPETLASDRGWTTVRYRMVSRWPDDQNLWLTEYKQRLLGHDPKVPGDQFRARQAAAEYYLAHREEMDAGAETTWQWAYAWADKPQTEFSSLQSAYNILFLDGQDAFNSECQCDPSNGDDDGETAILPRSKINAKRSALKMNVAPQCASTLVAGIDVQGEALFWVVAALGAGFTGQVCNYGTFPVQPQPTHVEYRKLTTKLSDVFPNDQQPGRIYRGLEALVSYLSQLRIEREDGPELQLAKIMVDRGFETDAVDLFIRQSASANILQASMGFGVGARDTPMLARPQKQGQRKGHNWIMYPPASGTRGKLYVGFDSNYWKTVVHNGLRAAPGDTGCLSLYASEKPEWHLTLAEHLRAEFVKKTFGNGRWCDEWIHRPSKPDNHWFDALVLCFVAASTLGISQQIAGPASESQPRVTARYVALR